MDHRTGNSSRTTAFGHLAAQRLGKHKLRALRRGRSFPVQRSRAPLSPTAGQSNVSAVRNLAREPGQARHLLPEYQNANLHDGESDDQQEEPSRNPSPELPRNAQPEFPVTPEAQFYQPSVLNLGEKARLLSQARYAARVSRGTYNGLGDFPSVDIPTGSFDSYWKVDTALSAEARLKIKIYDVCPTGCQAYTGAYENWEMNQTCSVCDKPRVRGGPVRYEYISIIDRLRGFYSNEYLSEKLRYRQVRSDYPDKSEDVFDGEHYKTLLTRNVTWRSSNYRASERYFSKTTDLALGLSTDGIPLQKHTGLDTWPLLITL
ncbi:hypothetical protein QFC24_006361 [Naganishia onofrii]|uniref:Uncharacterized protein n=1 Tax=Naganishia onofrii TaxID=1851511 RepID=A0ACC2X212_9TREE|nr:hypothetical protein QFC24_006361 [Naganishia onofrii]